MKRSLAHLTVARPPIENCSPVSEPRCRGALLKGFCYDSQRPLELTQAQWKERVALVIKAGGSKRVERGETFAHGSDAMLRFEVDAVIPV